MKLKRRRTLGENLLTALNIMCGILVVWVVISWMNVTIHNGVNGGPEQMFSWNFFVIFFNGEVKLRALYSFVTCILILSQLLLKAGQYKRILVMLLGTIVAVTMFMDNSWIGWVMTIAVALALLRELYIHKLKLAKIRNAAS